jgi:hypothetical protein
MHMSGMGGVTPGNNQFLWLDPPRWEIGRVCCLEVQNAGQAMPSGNQVGAAGKDAGREMNGDWGELSPANVGLRGFYKNPLFGV